MTVAATPAGSGAASAKLARLRERRGESDDGRARRWRGAGRLRHELLPPVVVHRFGRAVGRKAAAQVLADCVADGPGRGGGHES